MLWLSRALGVPPKTWGGIDDLMLWLSGALGECEHLDESTSSSIALCGYPAFGDGRAVEVSDDMIQIGCEAREARLPI